MEYVLDFMEYNQDIPDELYGKWLKVVNEKFVEIINEKTGNPNIDSNMDVSGGGGSRREPDEPQVGPDVQPLTWGPTQANPIQRKLAFVSKARPSQTNQNPQENSSNAQHHNKTGANESRLSKQEEENLADYLNLGMSIAEARESFRKELGTAELRLKIREKQKKSSTWRHRVIVKNHNPEHACKLRKRPRRPLIQLKKTKNDEKSNVEHVPGFNNKKDYV